MSETSLDPCPSEVQSQVNEAAEPARYNKVSNLFTLPPQFKDFNPRDMKMLRSGRQFPLQRLIGHHHQHRHDQILVLVSYSGHLDLVLPLPILWGLPFSILEYSGMLHIVEIHYMSLLCLHQASTTNSVLLSQQMTLQDPPWILFIVVSPPLLILLIDSTE